jgi:hypothetical protein
MVAVCCMAASADTPDVRSAGEKCMSMRATTSLGDELLEVNGQINLNMSSGQASRAVETVYDNTTNGANGAWAASIGAEFGDELRMVGQGPLELFSFSIYNSSNSTSPCLAVDVMLRFYDGSLTLLGSYNVGTVSFTGAGLLPGWYTTIDDLDLSAEGIVLPCVVVATQQYSNVVGDAAGTPTAMASVMYDPPTIGISSDDFWMDGGWYWFSGDPVANFYNKVDIDTPDPCLSLYDSTGGSALFGVADFPSAWIGDDLTWDPAAGYGCLEELTFTFWNWNDLEVGAAGIVEADYEFELLELDQSTGFPGSIAGVAGGGSFNFTYDPPLERSYYVTWTTWNLKEAFGIPIKTPIAAIWFHASNVVWTTSGEPGEVGQVFMDSVQTGTTSTLFLFDPYPGGSPGWYYFTDGTPAIVKYAMKPARWSLGDCNCDCAVDLFDIDPFVLALTSTPQLYAEYSAVYPYCDIMNADANEDGSVNNFDIDAFVGLLTGG